MLYNFTIAVLIVFFISFTIYFIRFQRTRCRYSESGSEPHDWDLWQWDWNKMVQFRKCQCCHFHDARSLDGKKK